MKFAFTDYTGGFFGSFNTGGASSGTWQDARLVGKLLVTFPSSTLGNYGGPNVTLDSSTGVISWSFGVTATGGANAGSPPDITIYFGGY
ncbi:hypothetical protein [Novosphingobium sp. TCA1]|uniref:hypothetical protein n=1 Tax=Novosphingobium sp. TCA1 TaxID=2682474 RepID=UPI00135CCF41|nr:hypothetical protein [Novosphingobium sp. TCA1]